MGRRKESLNKVNGPVRLSIDFETIFDLADFVGMLKKGIGEVATDTGVYHSERDDFRKKMGGVSEKNTFFLRENSEMDEDKRLRIPKLKEV